MTYSHITQPLIFSDLVVSALLRGKERIPETMIENLSRLEKHWRDIEFELKFEITERCNLNCSFCHQEFGKKNNCCADFSLSDFKNIIDRAKIEKQIKYIRITGGEPTLHPHVGNFLQYATEAGFHTVLNTNAMQLSPQKIEDLAPYVGTWKVSLPAADEAGTDAATSVPGTWNEKITSLEILREHNCNIDLLVVITPENIEKIPEFIVLAEKYGATCSFLRQESSASNRRPLSRKHIGQLLAILEKTHSQLGLALPFCATGDMDRVATLADGRIFCGPYSSLVVKTDGSVHHCYSRRIPHPTKNGFLNTAVHLAAEDFVSLPKMCRECAYGAVCLGGCRCGFSLRNSPGGPIDYLADLEHKHIYPTGEQG